MIEFPSTCFGIRIQAESPQFSREQLQSIFGSDVQVWGFACPENDVPCLVCRWVAYVASKTGTHEEYTFS